MSDFIPAICLTVATLWGVFMGWACTPKVITPKLYEQAAKICERNYGLDTLNANGDVICLNGGRFEVER